MGTELSEWKHTTRGFSSPGKPPAPAEGTVVFFFFVGRLLSPIQSSLLACSSLCALLLSLSRVASTDSKDAGAKHVEIKLKEFGLDLIEVSDNGSGISPSNYEGLALKYHTSKLSSFSDLSGVTSFGFRGEALSSLCELAGAFTVTTRTVNESVGIKLSYRRDGKLIKKVPRRCRPLVVYPTNVTHWPMEF